MEEGRGRAEAWLVDQMREKGLKVGRMGDLRDAAEQGENHTEKLLEEAIRQRDAAVREREIARSLLDATTRKGAAERAMLDEILTLPDIEPPTPGDGDNVAMAVANALEALREERDQWRERAFVQSCADAEGRWVELMELRDLRGDIKRAIEIGNTCKHRGADVTSVLDLAFMAKDLDGALEALLQESVE